jgi:hypothetical protein
VGLTSDFVLAGRWREVHLKNARQGGTVVVDNVVIIDGAPGDTETRFKTFRPCHLENCVTTAGGLIFERLVSLHPEMRI